MTDYKYIDIAVIEEMSGGDHELKLDIITMFMDGAPELLAEIRENLEQGNHRDISRIAHNLKPMFAYIGAVNVKESIEALEIKNDQKLPLDILAEKITEIENKMIGIKVDINNLKSELTAD